MGHQNWRPSLWVPGFSDGSVQNSGQHVADTRKKCLVQTSALVLSQDVTLTLKPYIPPLLLLHLLCLYQERSEGKEGQGPQRVVWGKEHGSESDGGSLKAQALTTWQDSEPVLLLRPSEILICKIASRHLPARWEDSVG